MPARYTVKVAGKADRRLVAFLEQLIDLLRFMLPPGWCARVELVRDPPEPVED